MEPAPTPPAGCPSYTSPAGVFYTCFHQDGSDWTKFVGTLKRLEKRLVRDTTCDDFLTSAGTSMGTIINDLLHPASTFTLAGTIIKLSSLTQLAGTEGDVTGQTAIIINSTAFLQQNQSTNYLTILHELAHLFNVIPTEGPSTSSTDNDNTVLTNCSKTIGVNP